MVTTVGSSSSPGSALGSYGGKEGPRDRRPDDAFLPRFFLTVSASASPSSVVLDTLRLLLVLCELGMGCSIGSEVDCSTLADGTASETGGCAMALGPGTVIGIDVLRLGGCWFLEALCGTAMGFSRTEEGSLDLWLLSTGGKGAVCAGPGRENMGGG